MQPNNMEKMWHSARVASPKASSVQGRDILATTDRCCDIVVRDKFYLVFAIHVVQSYNTAIGRHFCAVISVPKSALGLFSDLYYGRLLVFWEQQEKG